MRAFRPVWFELAPADLDFTRRAPFRIEVACRLEARPDRVFEIFARPEGMRDWIMGFVDCRWTSPEPHGVGSTREFELNAVTFREHFIGWQPGSRFCFAIDAMTLPLMRRMVEDIQLEPAGERATLLRWSVHYEPRLLVRAVHPIARRLIYEGYRASTERLARYILKNAASTT
ncbi:polyketide cyclase [Sorangium cellulosum]|uniref:Polyketide cyclase n=1 Tax=Sorangium cellulosum TaxID=56 RepID=A0A2L0F8T2_SORCE|nr:SRPBCC family protein [Sorangium cellulosum]AUX47996.1 polyketide cyclase [Sorangium cellulosum]